ncbi:alpha/beta fold hydrolase [Nocardioides sp. NPDC051685]|uniref:alpha/beta fold hydrolase n=1 Tax=Nocardioides sp. NPDC051685 TaxID=3364334 RepID=UPI0037A2E9EC
MADVRWSENTVSINGLRTRYLEAGSGPPLVLLHGGEFGGSSEIAWERVIHLFAETRRVIAPDILGFGGSAKVVDFVDGRGWRLRHLADLCAHLGVESADFVGNSMGGAMLLADAAAPESVLPIRTLVTICGGGELEDNEHMAALMDYDATVEGMRAIVAAMFADPSYAADDAYVGRRYNSSMLPGAWEAVAAARFRRPGHQSSGQGALDYARIAVPVLVVEGGVDKLKPAGWAGRLAAQLPDGKAVVVEGSGHCPQIERPHDLVRLVEDFVDEKVDCVERD